MLLNKKEEAKYLLQNFLFSQSDDILKYIKSSTNSCLSPRLSSHGNKVPDTWTMKTKAENNVNYQTTSLLPQT